MFTFFTNLFYLSTIIFLWHEIKWIALPMDETNLARKFHLYRNAHKDKSWNEYDSAYKNLLSDYLFSYGYVMLWMLLGIFTVQWPLFLAFFALQFIVVAPLSRLTRFGMAYTIIHWINSVIGFCFGVFVIVNHYYLHIKLY